MLGGDFVEPAHGLVDGLVGEFEGRMVDREHKPCADGLEHAPGLFGGGVHVIPGVVGADAEDREVDRFEVVVGFGLGGIAREEDALGVG